MVHEACFVKDRTNATLEEIDSAVKFKLRISQWGFLSLADFTGMDVIHKATIRDALDETKK